MKIAFALAGLHRVDRGAETAFIALASELARTGHEITLFGSGPTRDGAPYGYIRVPAIPRERFEAFPTFPGFRDETAWEDATFAIGLLRRFRPADFDCTVTCAFPFTHLALRRPRLLRSRPRHVFVTENGDWPAWSNDAEFRLFGCDGLVCTNPDFFERNRERYHCALIPNGVDVLRFRPGAAERARFGLPGGPIVLMVSALIQSKRVAEGVKAVAKIPEATLVVAGDGPLRDEICNQAANVLPGRYLRLSLPAAEMPALYRCADVFMHLSEAESFGNVFLEALATGLPIVACDSPRVRWIVGENAFLAAPGSIDSLVDAIRAALADDPDRAEARHRQAEEFGWPAIARRYDQFFAELQSNRQR